MATGRGTRATSVGTPSLYRQKATQSSASVGSLLVCGASFTPKTTVKDVLTLVQDYDNHRNIYKPEVIASRLISHRGSDFQIYLRLPKKPSATVDCELDRFSLLLQPAPDRFSRALIEL